MAFKAKNKNRVSINTKQTIDATHRGMMDHFNNQKEILDDLKEDVIRYEIELENLKLESSSNLILDLDLQNKIWKTEDRINELKKEIDNIENNEEENEYMIMTSKLLSDYYNIQESEKTIKNRDKGGKRKKKNKNDKGKKKTIMDWFEDADNGNKKDSEDKEEEDKEEEDNESEEDEVKLVNNKAKIYNDYMKLIDKDFTPDDNDDDNTSVDMCTKCCVEMLLNQNTGMLICPKCGLMEKIIINSDKPSYKDPPKEQTSFCYKRINHLNEFLAQFQAKETTEIPEDVYNEILVEIKKERIDNMADITTKKMKEILRKIRKNEYYEHTQYIINQLNGTPPPVISPEIEEILRSMFKKTLVPFRKYCPPNKRKNYLSYNYVMYKFFELLELDEYLHHFQLLKSRSKLHQQDQIWRNICNDLDWEYIPSL